jgi:hypothetical protein
MYCAYPRKINSPKMFLKGIFYWVQPFVDGWSKLKFVEGFSNKIMAYPIIVAIQYRWRKGVIDTKRMKKQ